MTIPFDEKQAKNLLSSRGYIIVSPKVVGRERKLSQSEQVVSVIGSRIKIASILGISRAAVHAWDKSGKVPPERASALVAWSRSEAPEYTDRLIAALLANDDD